MNNRTSPSALAAVRRKYSEKARARKIGEGIVEQLRQRRQEAKEGNDRRTAEDKTDNVAKGDVCSEE